MEKVFTENDLEILVATMNRTNLDFLASMFPNNHFSKYSILIINQSKDAALSSIYPSVRIINSASVGLSKSRNLALNNANGKILLIADDDVVFQKDFVSKIITAYNICKNATVINFAAVIGNGSYLKKYPANSKKQLNTFDIFNVSSIEMTINKERLDSVGVLFDENFGLGGEFELGEETVFLFDLKNKKQSIFFENEIIVEHEQSTSSTKKSIVEKYYIQGGFLTRALQNNYIFWLFVKLFFDLKQNKLGFKTVFQALESAKKGREMMINIQNEK
jgi:hypothetical protein